MKVLVVKRKEYVLELWLGERGRFDLVRTWPIAIGMPGRYRTRPGVYGIDVKDRQPEWRKPEAPWVPEEEWGEIVPGGAPENPIRARWLGLDPDEGVGIHGTTSLESLGKAESHGCLRMAPDDVKELYDLIPNPDDTITPVFVD